MFHSLCCCRTGLKQKTIALCCSALMKKAGKIALGMGSQMSFEPFLMVAKWYNSWLLHWRFQTYIKLKSSLNKESTNQSVSQSIKRNQLQVQERKIVKKKMAVCFWLRMMRQLMNLLHAVRLFLNPTCPASKWKSQERKTDLWETVISGINEIISLRTETLHDKFPGFKRFWPEKCPLRYSTSSTTSCLTISSEISGLILLELGDPGTWSGLAVCSVAGVFARWWSKPCKTVGTNCSQSSNSRPCGWEKTCLMMVVCVSVFFRISSYTAMGDSK